MPLFISSNFSKISYAKLSDVKSNGTNGGSITADTDTTRTLNTLETSESWISLSSNQFTLLPGTYIIAAIVPGFAVTRFKAWLHNVTNNQAEILGNNGYSTSGASGYSEVHGKFVVSGSSKVFELRMRCTSTRASDGCGSPSNVGLSEVFSLVELFRLD